MAYGQTGSGKTYTMDGPITKNSYNNIKSDYLGINHKAIQEIFYNIEERKGDIN